MQSKRNSAFEAGTNVAIGYLVSVLANVLILPLFGYNVTIGDSFAIGMAFTAVSLARSYVLRRVFNRLDKPDD
jgi:acetyltransferase-like isoleucine patch superfamily enzyme